jgi:hypothetical protein
MNGIQRNILLSTAYFLSNELVASGWTNVAVAGELPDDFEVVLAKDATGSPDEIAVPAIRMSETYSRPGQILGVGETTREHDLGLVIFIFAESMGQEKGLRYFLEATLTDKSADFYDFTNHGYPPSGVMTKSAMIDYNDIRSVPVYSFGNINAASRFGGAIYLSAKTTRQKL